MNIKELFIEIDGQENDLSFSERDGCSFNMKSKTTRWLETLATTFSNPDKFGLVYHCYLDSFALLPYYKNGVLRKGAGWLPTNAAVEGIEDKLWNHLAPRMLRKDGRTGDGGVVLRHRRIYCNARQDDWPQDENSEVDLALWRRYS